MTDDELRKLAEAALEQDKAATPGPWRMMHAGNAPLLDGSGCAKAEVEGPPRPYNDRWIGWHRRENHFRTFLRAEDATLVAAARTREPELARAVLRLLEDNASLRRMVTNTCAALERPANPLRGKAKCPACGRMSRITTASCDHCGVEDK